MQTTVSRKWGIGAILGFLIILILLGAAAIFLLTTQSGEGPIVTILQPDAELVISAGQGLVVVAQIDSSQPLERCELLIDGEVVLQQAIQPGAPMPVTVSFPWFSTTPGRQTLSVIAYDSQQRPSAPAQVPVTVLKAERLADELGDGTASPTDPSEQDTADDQSDGEAQGSPGESQPADPDDGLLQAPDDVPGDPGGPGGDGNALPPSISFGVSFARVGAQGVEVYFVAQAAGDNPLDRIEFMRTRRSGGFSVPYTEDCDESRRCFHDDTFNMRIAETWVVTAQAFDVEGQASELKTEVVQLLNDNPLGPAIVNGGFQVPAPEVPREAELAMNDEVLEMQDAVELVIGQEIQDDIGEPRIAEYHCSMRSVVLEVPYTYVSNHGEDVYLLAQAESQGDIVATDQARIQHDGGVARLEMQNITPEVETTEQLELILMTGAGDFFYDETADITIMWGLPRPDLHVADAGIVWGVEDGRVYFDIQNLGCAPVENFDVILWREDGSSYSKTFEESIPPGETKTLSVPARDPNLYSRAFQVYVDPDNTIVETNERNNSLLKFPITIRYVLIHGIDIHNTMEDWPEDDHEGEFWVEVTVGDEETRRPGEGWDTIEWTKGFHNINYSFGSIWQPIMLSPTLNWNQDLHIFVGLNEDDWGSFPDYDFVSLYQSYDMLQEDNWKAGGDFSAKSDDGNFTVYWQIVTTR